MQKNGLHGCYYGFRAIILHTLGIRYTIHEATVDHLAVETPLCLASVNTSDVSKKNML